MTFNWANRYSNSNALFRHEWSSISFEMPISLWLNCDVFLVEFTLFALEIGKTVFILLLNRSLI